MTEIPYRTEVSSSYVNTVAVTSDHNPHCTLIALHMTVGSAAIPGIPFCDESSCFLSAKICGKVRDNSPFVLSIGRLMEVAGLVYVS
jgi:hypothetical protein